MIIDQTLKRKEAAYAVGEAPNDGSPDEHSLGTQGKRLDDVGASSDAPIHEDLAPTSNGSHHLRYSTFGIILALEVHLASTCTKKYDLAALEEG